MSSKNKLSKSFKNSAQLVNAYGEIYQNAIALKKSGEALRKLKRNVHEILELTERVEGEDQRNLLESFFRRPLESTELKAALKNYEDAVDNKLNGKKRKAAEPLK